MKESLVSFLVLIALLGRSVAQEKPPGHERRFEAHPTDCSVYYELQTRHCPRGLLFNSEEEKCDSPGNVICGCRGDGTCEKSPEGHSNDDNGDGGDGHEREVKSNGKDTSNKHNKGPKHHGDDSDSEESHENDSKGDRHEDDDNNHKGHGKDKEHRGSAEESGEDDDDNHKEHGKDKEHRGSQEKSDEDDDDNHKGHGKDKKHRGSQEKSDEDDDDNHKGHGKDKKHRGSQEKSGEDDDDNHKGHGKDKEHRGSAEKSGEDDDDNHKGHGKDKKHRGSQEKSGEDDDDNHEGHGKDKKHRGSAEKSGEDDDDSDKGHGHDRHEDRTKFVCDKLQRSQYGKWRPRQCSKKSQKLGRICRLECSRGFVRSGGSQVQCMESGWEGEYGVNIIPTCISEDFIGDTSNQPTGYPPTSEHTTSYDNEPSTGNPPSTVEEISDEFLRVLNYTDGGFEQVLFIVDSSQNVGEATFYRTELNFVKVITEVLFSRITFFGLTIYNDYADAVIPLAEYTSSGFIQRVDNVEYSPRDGSDMANVLDRSFSDIRRSRKQTLIVLISGTESSTDGSGEARLIQSRGNIIIPVVVGEDNRNTATSISSTNEGGSPRYFLFQSWESFSSTMIYISQSSESHDGTTHPTPEGTTGSDSNDGTGTGTTHPTTEGTSGDGTTETQSTGEETTISVEEISDEFLSILNYTDGRYEQVLFIVDSSQNVGEATFYRTELNFVKVITEVVFSRIFFFGLTVYNDVADVVIPLDAYGSSGFIQRVDNVEYSPRDGSDMANVLDRSFSDILRSGLPTLVVLISGTESSTDASGEARLIQNRGNIIIPVVVGEVNRNTATSVSSTNEEGSSLYFLFSSWKSFNSSVTYISQNYGATGTTGTGDESTSTEATETTHPTTDVTSGSDSNDGTGTGTTHPTPEGTSDDGMTYYATPSTGEETTIPVEESSDELLSILNYTGGSYDQVLFIVDSSQNVGEATFYRTELNFVKVITEVLFSRILFFGLTVYNDVADVVIPLDAYGSSRFIQRVDNVEYSPRDGSDMANVLDRSFSDILRSGLPTLVVLISGTESSTDGSGEARLIESRGNIIIPVVVGEVNRNTATSVSSTNEEGSSLYFLFSSWKSFNSSATYISQNYGATGTTGTGDESTSTEATDTTHPTTDVTSGSDSNDGTTHPTPEGTTGSDSNDGTGAGTTHPTPEGTSGDGTTETQSTGEETTIPGEESSDELLSILNYTGGSYEQVLFIVDSSQNVGEATFYRTELNFVKVITEVLFSRIRFFGLTVYNDVADVVIPLDEYGSSRFIQRVDNVEYSPRDGSDMANVLDRSFSDIQRSGLHTLVVLISCTESSTDGSGEARLIQNRGNIIIPVVVGEVNRNTATSVSSTNEEGSSLYYLSSSWKSFNSSVTYISQNYGATGTTGTGDESTSSEATETPHPTTEVTSVCDALENIENGHWEYSSCSEESSTEGTVCRLVCASGYDLTGYAEVTCTNLGWQSSDGYNEQPACISAEEVGEEVVSVINGTSIDFEQVLFIVDSSRDIGEATFYNVELNFVKVITKVALSTISYFGLITYNDYAEVVIPFTQIESSEFIQRVDSVQYSPRDGSDIANVLDRAFSIIRRSRRPTLVVFISGTESSSDGSGEARLIKSRGNFIIPVIVGEVNRDTAISISSMNETGSPLYFLFQSWENFNATIRKAYVPDSTVQFCVALEDSQRGHWEEANCSLGTSELGTICELVCEEGYELSGTPEVVCNQSGWVSYEGDNKMPSCKTIEEIGEDFIANINRTLGRPANLIFVVDGSGSLTEQQFGLETGLVNAIVRAFPLSEVRSAGVVTFSSDATIAVSANSDDTCTFVSDVSAITYPRGGTNIALALQVANSELEKNAVHDFTITFLITDGVSTTDPTEPAAVLKQGDNVLFAIGVGDYDAEQLTSIATYFYPIRDFDVFNSLKDVLETEYANKTGVEC